MMDSVSSPVPPLPGSRLRRAALSTLLALAAPAAALLSPAAALLSPAAALAQPATAPSPAVPAAPAKAGTAVKAATAPGKSPAAAGTNPKARAAKPSKASVRKKAPVPPVEPEVVVTAADDQQLLAAKEVYLGESGCEFDQKIQLQENLLHPGYVDMSFNKKKYMMKPVISTTGALRLEDIRSETLMIQITNKTMLMNQKTGQRLADNCMHINHRAVAADDVGQGLLRQ